MAIERVSNPDPAAPPTSADRTRAIMLFAVIEAFGVVCLAIFLMGFFALDWFPGQPRGLLVGALLAFALYVAFALWASGLLRTIKADRTNAGR